MRAKLCSLGPLVNLLSAVLTVQGDLLSVALHLGEASAAATCCNVRGLLLRVGVYAALVQESSFSLPQVRDASCFHTSCLRSLDIVAVSCCLVLARCAGSIREINR